VRLEVPLRGNIIHWVYLWTDCWEKYLNLRDGQTKTGKLDGWMDLIDIIRASSAAHINKFWKELERCWPWSGRPRPTTLQPPRSNGKTRGCYCSCKLLIMGGEGTETCWATHKPQVINLWKCCILLVDLFESYDDARTCERQILEGWINANRWTLAAHLGLTHLQDITTEYTILAETLNERDCPV